jgi:penicillin-binding protein 2
MYLDSEDRRALTPQLALRVAVVGGIALIAFSVVFFRLWYLQVLSGDKYRAEANNNRVREIKVQAPRGEIVDREGRTLVDNRVGLSVRVSPDELPGDLDRRRGLYERLARVLDMRPDRVEKRVEEQLAALPYSAATVKADVSKPLVYYLLENLDDFPGVEVEQAFLREYPRGDLAAQLFGYVGEVTEEQLDDERYRGVDLGDRVGQAGLEYEYDRFLRGRNGAGRVEVDALGTLRRQLAERRPEQGRRLRLSVDLDVQRAGQQALGGAAGAAFAVMNVRNGQVVALGSSPTFDPNLFSKAIRPADFDRLNSEEADKPLFNRAIQGGYPTGSTFKLVTATAALEGGLITPETPLFDGGSLTVGGISFGNAGGAAYGTLALRRALTVSSDVFFYQLGLEANGTGKGVLLQRWARRLGFGTKTGIDLPNEQSGLVPSPKWRNELFRKDLTDRPWSAGDNVNLSVGQGDLQASPMQLAVAYAAIANGGKVVRPRLGQRVEDSAGRPLQELEAPGARKLDIDPAHRQAILDGLRGAASEPGGTSTSVFADFKIPIAGKTGTAETSNGIDQSWYAALAPYPDPKYVVVATFEDGGFGAETAAPAVKQILAELFGVKDSGGVGSGGATD